MSMGKRRYVRVCGLGAVEMGTRPSMYPSVGTVSNQSATQLQTNGDLIST
jgi:hypothetical protein